jgi:flagellin
MEQTKTFARLSSGYRINGASDDAAGVGITESLGAQIRSFTVAERNANDGISMAETADGAAVQVSEILGRLRELAVQSSNGALSGNDRTNIDTEFTALRSEIDRIANVTKFGGQDLLAGTATAIDFQVGIGTTADDQISVTTTALGINASAVDTVANAQAAIDDIDTAIQDLGTSRQGFGSAINRLQSAASNVQTMRTNLASARSRIKDTDVAEEAAAMARQQVLSQAGASVLSQANSAPQMALSLLR